MKIISIIGDKLEKTKDKNEFNCHIFCTIKKDNIILLNVKNKYIFCEREIATFNLSSGKQTKLKPIQFDIELTLAECQKIILIIKGKDKIIEKPKNPYKNYNLIKNNLSKK